MPGWTGSNAGRVAVVVLAGVALAACATPRYATTQGPGHSSGAAPPRAMPGRAKTGDPYQVGGIWYVPREQPGYDEVGVASWYGDAFNMKATANGEIFDMTAISAAHTTLPLPSIVEVTNLENGRKLNVRVNDRGPFYGGRIIDLSREAAHQLGYEMKGTAKVRVRYVGPAPLLGRDAGVRYASASPGATLPVRLLPPPAALPTPPRPAAGLQVEVAQALPPPAAPVETRALPPLSAPSSAPSSAAVVPANAVGAAAGPPSLRIQAGAYASEANAERAASQLSGTGSTVIESVPREGGTLYRVMLTAPSDEAEAYALRDRIAAAGFKDARVVQAF
jgi:rare lipoprotein A